MKNYITYFIFNAPRIPKHVFYPYAGTKMVSIDLDSNNQNQLELSVKENIVMKS